MGKLKSNQWLPPVSMDNYQKREVAIRELSGFCCLSPVKMRFVFCVRVFFFSIKVGTNNRDINAIQHWYIGYIEVSYNRGTPKSSIDKISINGFSMKSTIHNGDPPWLWKAPYLELDGSGWMNTTNIALAWTVETFNFWWVNHRKGSPQNGEIRYWSSDFWVLNHIES